MSPARIAVVGAGWWSANHHLPSLAQYDGAALVAVCDPVRERAEEVATDHDVPEVVTDVEDLLGLRLDGVVVATPHDTHHAIAGRLLDAGIAVLVEKPLTTTTADAVDLVRRAERAGVPLAVGYTDQYTATSALVRNAVQGEIGELVQVMAEFSSSTAGLFAQAEDAEQAAGEGAEPAEDAEPEDQHPGTYSADHGGGQAHTQLTHVMGMVCWVTGREVAEVAAMVDQRGLEADVDDAAVIRFLHGGAGVVTSTGMAGEANGERHHVRYLGTRGTVDQDMLGDRAWLRRGDGSTVELTGGQEDVPRTWLPARRFADLTVGRATNPAPGRSAAAAVACIEALLTSAETRQFVTVSRLP
ncbi:Gfo/Idh/MocA family protein [Actinotalea sp. C106]|uniref:Gfo/Idh/MocA family protein n=1 Tax=Actinotalea sp. C106 TaxID=2908644 RepID=UPI002028D6DF|nr:Gfo/Idh/MocA family oxidoreductase [Actinotalea sp. C106]